MSSNQKGGLCILLHNLWHKFLGINAFVLFKKLFSQGCPRSLVPLVQTLLSWWGSDTFEPAFLHHHRHHHHRHHRCRHHHRHHHHDDYLNINLIEAVLAKLPNLHLTKSFFIILSSTASTHPASSPSHQATPLHPQLINRLMHCNGETFHRKGGWHGRKS